MSQTAHLDFPEYLPPRVERWWRGVFRYFENSNTTKQITRRDIARMIEENETNKVACSESTVTRICNDYPTLCPKPKYLRRGIRPPWEAHPELLDKYRQALQLELPPVEPIVADDEVIPFSLEARSGEQTVQIEGVAAPDGKIIQSSLRLRDLGCPAVAAVYACVLLMDGMDGKWDGVIHWCRVLLAAANVHV